MHILSSIIHETVWGGEKLAIHLNSQSKRIGHVYSLISGNDMSSVIMNGEYRGWLFKDFFTSHKKQFCLDSYEEFPFRIALVEAREDLSIQVHPGSFKEIQGKKYGKNESLYFIEPPICGYIYNGCKYQTIADIKKKINEGQIMDIVGTLKVEKGDYVFIESGTLHACTAGSLCYEIEENCDIIYRFYDYDRVDLSGDKRSLHIEKALASLDPLKKSRPQKYGNFPITEKKYITQLYRDDKYINRSNTLECLTVLEGLSDIKDIAVSTGTTVVLEPGERIVISPSLFIVSRPIIVNAEESLIIKEKIDGNEK
jgi:mannose-6-phosphate isomerase class I